MSAPRQTDLRRAAEDDVGLLVAWHADPEVSRYWDEEVHTPETIREELTMERKVMWIVQEDGVPVGMLQHWWEADPPLRGGLDGYLIPSARGRGIMSGGRAPACGGAARRRLGVGDGRSLRLERAGHPRLGERRLRRGSRHARRRRPPGAWVLMRFA